MCIGVPLRVKSIQPSGAALCGTADSGDQPRAVDVSLLGAPPTPGDWLLAHVNLAIRALDAHEARQISDALQAVSAAAAGQPFEHLLADLIEREPELPEHLRSAIAEPEND